MPKNYNRIYFVSPINFICL